MFPSSCFSRTGAKQKASAELHGGKPSNSPATTPGSVSETQVQISRATHIDSIDGPHKNSGRRICFGIVVPCVTNCSLKLHPIENLKFSLAQSVIPGLNSSICACASSDCMFLSRHYIPANLPSSWLDDPLIGSSPIVILTLPTLLDPTN